MSSDTCLKIEYDFGLVGLHLNLHVSEIKNFLQDITHSRNSAKTEHFTVMLLNCKSNQCECSASHGIRL